MASAPDPTTVDHAAKLDPNTAWWSNTQRMTMYDSMRANCQETAARIVNSNARRRSWFSFWQSVATHDSSDFFDYLVRSEADDERLVQLRLDAYRFGFFALMAAVSVFVGAGVIFDPQTGPLPVYALGTIQMQLGIIAVFARFLYMNRG